MGDFTHLNEEDEPGWWMSAIRRIQRSGSMWISVYEPETLSLIKEGRIKGDVLAVAQVAGIQGPREPAI